MSRAIWAASAQRDLAELDAFYRQLSPTASERIARAAIAAGRFLADNPQAGEAVSERAIRKWRVRQTPYLLFYRPVPEGVRIVRLIHAARDWRQQL